MLRFQPISKQSDEGDIINLIPVRKEIFKEIAVR